MKKLTMLLVTAICVLSAYAGQPLFKNPSDPPGTVKGKITDKDGNPLIAVSVRVRGSNAGALTGTDGTFTLSPVTENTLLVVSSVGYNVMEITVHRSTKGYTAAVTKDAEGNGLQVTEGEQL